ncbi:MULTISPECIES: DedA family protein [Xanthobacter]|uniref:Cytochrome o ubiquinol oxidase n=1 Tax=Xanthobacter flavus TaxID=281 RepID=A0A9W6CI44_XANFL|nr:MULTISPECIES: DedA family protein [Xanthobacter]MBN8915868.1 DedA family protein [Hyphomicrobiales bacterium]MDR6334078.1 membrane protein DedA with SNARE-associated domain [Xanthobacter flavus]NMN58333.1 membrane protein DedA with SNARE-associated domain [Xanthobacter sp. SG618]UDQ87390.1 DedA family protein [Xanthobacter autotrophicus]UJX44398.1 DedA family protein [Xanthobacter sp. YC-JY1]
MFDLSAIVAATTAFVEQHHYLAPAVVFGLAFGESLALISFFIPATVLLLAIGALIEAAGLHFFPIWLAAAAGAALGDAISYWLGFHYKERAKNFWPLSRRPDLVARAEDFFQRFGVWGVAIGRFFGPLRAVVPLIAGVLAMRQTHFQVANVASAGLWAFAMLAPGAAALKLMGF